MRFKAFLAGYARAATSLANSVPYQVRDRAHMVLMSAEGDLFFLNAQKLDSKQQALLLNEEERAMRCRCRLLFKLAPYDAKFYLDEKEIGDTAWEGER